jgi:eukaryotic-like serine/threonine-protein kinase
VGDVEKLIKAGKKGEAIAALEKLQRANPKSAYIPYLLGNLYFERMWWTDGMQRYRAAIANNREYRKRAVLIKNTIRALGSAKTSGKAWSLLQSVIGAPALPYLRSAAKSDGNPKVRSKATTLVKKISKRR